MMGMTSKEKEKVAGAVGGKTARACDGCLRRRARWYCAADDAFLCQICDTSVHSANPLARRHERLRLRVSSPSLPSSSPAKVEELVVPAWYTRKARTPRGGKNGGAMSRQIVPESADSSDENKEEEHDLLYHVPIFDPALSEFCSPPPLEDSNSSKGEIELGDAVKSVPVSSQLNISPSINDSIMISFSPSDAELKEFAADMEALLGQNSDDSFDMESLGLVESPVELDVGANVKLETDNGAVNGVLCGAADLLEAEVSGEILDIDFDCGSPVIFEEGEEKIAVNNMACHEPTPFLQHRKFVLRLDYEAIIASWERSPWTDGERPHARLDECWPDYSGMWNMGSGRSGSAVGVHGTLDETGAVRAGLDGGREARVSRYREKRRTRLFSKKIRYEVRKLNAEKRPRMKGRFVKRGSPSSHA